MRRFLAFFLTLSIIFSACLVSATADTAGDLPFSIWTSSGRQSDNIIIGLQMDDKANLAAASFTVKFDASVIEGTNVEAQGVFSQADCLFVYSINNEIGEIEISAVRNTPDLAWGLIAYMHFTIKEDAPVGESELHLSVDSAADVNGVPFATTAEKGILYTYENDRNARLWFYNANAYPNQSVEVSIYLDSNNNEISAGDIEISYNKELLDCLSAREGYFFNSGEIMSTTNINEKAGTIKLSFATNERSYQSGVLLTLKFRPKSTAAEQSSRLTLSKLNLYGSGSTVVPATKNDGYVYIEKTEPGDVMFNINDAEQVIGKTFTTSVDISANSGVSALDFELSYDTSGLALVSAKKGSAMDGQTQMSINTDTTGIIKAALINNNGITEEGSILDLEFIVSAAAHVNNDYQITMNVTNICDSNFAKLNARASAAKIRVLDGPDDTPIVVFKNHVLGNYLTNNGFDLNGDGEMSEREMASFSYLGIWGEDIREFSDLKYAANLNYLYLDNCNINDLSALYSMPQLNNLRLGNNKITDISEVSSLKNLRYIEISYNRVTDISPLASLKKLGTVDISYTDVSSLSALSNLPELYDLSVAGTKIDGLTQVASLKRLQYINISDLNIRNLTLLSELKELHGITASNNQITDLTPLAGLEKLYSLNLYNNKITDLSQLNEFDKLTDLLLNSNPIEDITPLGSMTNLISLDLMYIGISDITALSGLTGLENLYLAGNCITDISALVNLTGLRHCYLSDNYLNLSDESVSSVIDTLENNGCNVDAYWQYEKAEKVELDYTSLNMATGESEYLSVTTYPQYGNFGPSRWKTSNPKVAVVTEYGMVTALSPGTATITVITGLQQAECTVTVTHNISMKLESDNLSVNANSVSGSLAVEVAAERNTTALCIIALYDDNNRLLGKRENLMNFGTGANPMNVSIDFKDVPNPRTLKVLMWSDYSRMQPMSEPMVITLIE